jgi:hypothetical protein
MTAMVPALPDPDEESRDYPGYDNEPADYDDEPPRSRLASQPRRMVMGAMLGAMIAGLFSVGVATADHAQPPSGSGQLGSPDPAALATSAPDPATNVSTTLPSTLPSSSPAPPPLPPNPGPAPANGPPPPPPPPTTTKHSSPPPSHSSAPPPPPPSSSAPPPPPPPPTTQPCFLLC